MEKFKKVELKNGKSGKKAGSVASEEPAVYGNGSIINNYEEEWTCTREL